MENRKEARTWGNGAWGPGINQNPERWTTDPWEMNHGTLGDGPWKREMHHGTQGDGPRNPRS